ncbi:MAG: hypothetical protein J5850_02755, partial [Clostridia bacterium]|nr:hypothetical protein [Clostridia bacterium]
MANDIIKALENWRKMITVTEEDDLSDPIIQNKLKNTDKRAERALSIFDKERKSSPILNTEITTTNDMVMEFSSVQDMALAWASYGSHYYHDKGVLDTVLYCLEWLNANRYGRNEIEGHGWRDMRLFNWHSWEIGSPTFLENTLAVLGNIVSYDDCRRYLEVFDYRVPHARDYGSNKVEYGRLISGSGLLKNDPEQAARGLKEIENTYEYADGGNNDWQGFFTDGSYIFHTRHPMNSTYGLAHFGALIQLYQKYRGTCFENPDMINKLRYWATLTFLPFVHNGIVSKSVLGRHPTGGVSGGLGILRNCCELLPGANKDDYYRIGSEIKANVVNGRIDADTILAGISREAGKEFKKLMNDESVPSEYGDRCQAFVNEDRMIYRSGKTAFSLSMSSSRIYNYECINHENMTGWYGGDGMMTVYGSNISSYRNYWDKVSPYRYPGVTLDTRERIADTIAQANEYLSSEDYVGGLSDGVCGLASMNLESYHSDGVLISKRFYQPDKSYGGPPIKRDCSLKGYKSWFFNNGEAVCLGCNINAHDDAEVITVVDSRKTDESALVEESENGVYIEGFGGYIFPENTKFKVEKYERNGAFFCDVIISHGVNPENAVYQYAVLPEVSKERFDYLRNNPDFAVPANNGAIQAVIFKDGTEQYAFREKCCFNGISVSEPLL